ncbi:hypothetical protein N5S72_09985 [Aliarcobacter cryaerophilus]|uniref:hypothetical protein n=1 Tax=Aliarcobacter cryaerophilus TaxID=28198 RepID=UPI0021B41761|nr:hypothetical protein [Aliarcobacter cryaerophilus]MCT7464778.1 hypothetical protein [Aliarcobacter cryaerophilus]
MSNEDKHEKFKRIVSKRVNELINKIDILGNCSNKSNYYYTEEDVNKIFNAIELKLRETKSQFKIKKKKDFKLD